MQVQTITGRTGWTKCYERVELLNTNGVPRGNKHKSLNPKYQMTKMLNDYIRPVRAEADSAVSVKSANRNIRILFGQIFYITEF